jgi:hypothetical protein
MTDANYTFWSGALALVGDCGKLSREQITALGGCHENEPRAGFWRVPVKERAASGRQVVVGWDPVAIWYEDFAPVALVYGFEATDPCIVGSHAVWHPITEETYHAVMAGSPWPAKEEA